MESRSSLSGPRWTRTTYLRVVSTRRNPTGLGSWDLVSKLQHALPQGRLGLHRRIHLLSFAVPALHGEIQLRGLEARDLEIRFEPTAPEGEQAMLEALQRARENRHLVHQDGPGSTRRLLTKLVHESQRLIPDPEEQQGDHGGGEGPGHDQGAQVELEQAQHTGVDWAKRAPRIPSEVPSAGDARSAQER